MSDTIDFGPDFFFGSATSSFQIEGRSPDIPQGESIWDTFCAEPGRIADGSNGLVACDHVHRYADDVQLMADLNLAKYRFSVAWPKVIPNGTGPASTPGLDFYDRLVDALLDKGIEPMLTLYHWDLPQALDDTGGWLNRDTAYAFAEYAQVMLDRLGDRVATWTTFNEPYVSAGLGYVTGEHAPGHRNLREGITAAHHILLAHGLGMERIRASVPDCDAGIVLNFTPAEPASDAVADVSAAAVRNGWENEWYAGPIFHGAYPQATVDAFGWDQSEVLDGDLALISAPVDVLGVNFYTRSVVSSVGQQIPFGSPKTEMGWEIHPPSLRQLLLWLHATYSPTKIVVTENGCAMPDTERVDGAVNDQDRIDYLRAHLTMVHEARAAGAPIAGYMVWSLMDNFEWALGYEKRFGIVEIEPETLRRIPKASARWFAQLADSGVLPD